MSGPSRHIGARPRGKCPVCGKSRILATTTRDGRAQLDQAVMARHNLAGQQCLGSGRAPLTVTL